MSGTTIIHRDALKELRESVGGIAPHLPHDKNETVYALLLTTIRLFDHIDAMREHRCFYKWSAVKAARSGGPTPRCTACGEESPNHRAKLEAESFSEFLEDAMKRDRP